MKKIQNIYDDPKFFSEYKKLRLNKAGFNDLLEQPAIRSLLPDLSGKIILDIGCGFGDFDRYCIKNGASSVDAIDPSLNMINEAKILAHDMKITYQQVAVENYSSTKKYDLIIASLVFHYVEDIFSEFNKIRRCLTPGGCFIFSIEHPICTANPQAVIGSDDNAKTFHPVYNYRDEIKFQQKWFVENVEKYHHTLSTYINALIDNGFKIEKILEPMPTDDMIEKNNAFIVHKIRPPLLMIKSTV